MHEEKIQEALAALSITQLWEQEGMPGKPGKSCCSPFREDRHPSCSVYWNEAQGKECWTDYATGEGGDAIAFYAKLKGLTNRQAVKPFCDKALGQNYHDSHRRSVRRRITKRLTPHIIDPAKELVAIPEKEIDCWDGELRRGNNDEIEALASLRNITNAGLLLAGRRGVLKFATVGGKECWVTTDASRNCADHRLLSGDLFKGGAKTKGLYGWKHHWPLGIDAEFEPGDLGPNGVEGIIFAEGGADLLANYDLIQRAGHSSNYIAVCMPGTSSKIPNAVLPLFSGKRIFFIPDADQVGIKAMDGWRKRIFENSKPAAWDTLRLDEAGWTTQGGRKVTDSNEILYAGDTAINQTIAWLREGKRPVPTA